MDDDGVALGLQTEIRGVARELENLARAAAFLGRPELSGMLGCMAELLEQQAKVRPSSQPALPAARPRRTGPPRRAYLADVSQRA
ncbi:hypothetical protein [Roseomonas sp. WA12]